MNLKSEKRDYNNTMNTQNGIVKENSHAAVYHHAYSQQRTCNKSKKSLIYTMHTYMFTGSVFFGPSLKFFGLSKQSFKNAFFKIRSGLSQRWLKITKLLNLALIFKLKLETSREGLLKLITFGTIFLSFWECEEKSTKMDNFLWLYT